MAKKSKLPDPEYPVRHSSFDAPPVRHPAFDAPTTSILHSQLSDEQIARDAARTEADLYVDGE